MEMTIDEAKRTAPLAYWRYAHDYLQGATKLCRDNRTLCRESQVPYHMVAQGIEFALHAYLRATGMTMTELRAQLGHSLVDALVLCEARGLPPMPDRWRPAILELAACHKERGFEYFVARDDAYPDITPFVDAGVWILDHTAPMAAEHYVRCLGAEGSPTVDEFVVRLRAALSTMSDVVAPRPPRTEPVAHD
jgi:hypothetical protein